MLSIDDMSARTASTAIYHFESSLSINAIAVLNLSITKQISTSNASHCRQVREQHAEHAAFVIEIEE